MWRVMQYAIETEVDAGWAYEQAARYNMVFED